MARLKELYKKELAPKLKEELGLANVMDVPRITKITLNMGVGEAVADKKILDHAVSDMERICGQKVVKTLARKSALSYKAKEKARDLQFTPIFDQKNLVSNHQPDNSVQTKDSLFLNAKKSFRYSL